MHLASRFFALSILISVWTAPLLGQTTNLDEEPTTNSIWADPDQVCRTFIPWMEPTEIRVFHAKRSYASDVLSDFTRYAVEPGDREPLTIGDTILCEKKLYPPNDLFYVMSGDKSTYSGLRFYIDPDHLREAELKKRTDPDFYFHLTLTSWIALRGADTMQFMEGSYRAGFKVGEAGVSHSRMVDFVNKYLEPYPETQLTKGQHRRIMDGWAAGYKKLHGYQYSEPWYEVFWSSTAGILTVIALVASGLAPIFGLYRLARKRKWLSRRSKGTETEG
ncbi:MAG: hypothetical protein V4574_15615 [Pseudomonadota bacterium]